MNPKLKQVISIFLVELIILLPFAIADSLSISNVRVEEVRDVSARIKWETSSPSEGIVSFGTTSALGQTRSGQNFIRNHSILLTNLAENTPYYFDVTADDGITRIKDNNNNSLYKFTTLPRAPLFVNASIPPYYNRSNAIDIKGNSIRLARINIYVNSELPRTLNADDNGNFLFSEVSLNEGNNTIRLTAESQSQLAEKTYKIVVDTLPPVIALNEIPGIVGYERIIVNGSANEPVNISFYVTAREEDNTPPPKVLNLTNTSIKENLVELEWSSVNITDFGKYIIYRNEKPIAIIDDVDYTDYSDVFVNSNQTYAYKVAAMDSSGNLGESSKEIEVKTFYKGLADRPELEEVNIYEDIEGLQAVITTDGNFAEEIELGSEDGFYNIKIEAVDKAGNQWLYEKEVMLDQEDPEIEIISPKTNARIYESYADMVTIRGKTEPGARVYLYVKRTPFGILNDTWDIYGFPDEIQQLSEADLRADCRLDIQGEEQCKTHADYEAVADADGYFEFEDVDLTSMWAGAFKITEYPTGEPYYQFVDREKLKDYIESSLFLVAVDAAGRKGTEQASYDVVSCWTTGLTWDASPLIEYQSPTFLNVERLKEGTESIYFYFNFTYHGEGLDTKNTKVTNLLVSNACGSGYLEKQERYEYSCKILRSCREKLSPTGKTAYIACPLGRLDGVEKWTDDNWKSFIEAVKNEMSFPFKLTITYDEETRNNTVSKGKTQYLCSEVTYAVDAAKINPKKVLPDWLLYNFVDFLNKTINKLNEWIEKIRKILEWAAIGCMATFFVKFVTQIYRRITCNYDRFFKKMTRIAEDSTQKEDECRQCIEQNEAPSVLKKFDDKKDVQDLISDTCLATCYPSCSGAWKSEESLYTTYRWSCDRVFGHKTPSRWTETATDTQLFQKLSEGSGCANDESVRGRPLRAVSCIDLEEKYRIKGTFDRDDKCLEITSSGIGQRTETLYHIDGPYSVGENVYKISKMDTSAPSLSYDFVIKQNDEYYLAALEQSCKEICNGELTGERVQIGLRTEKGKVSMENEGNVNSQKMDNKQEGNYYMTYGCITPNECKSYATGDVKQLSIEGGNENVDVKTATPMGYTRDCFSPEYVSGDPDKRIECCCINSQAGALPQYYQPGDIENKDGTFGNQGYESMRWSYRYYKTGYKNKQYNENRYIAERDYTACFGQNQWLYDGFSQSQAGEGNLLIIDPMKDHIAAFQCVAISQILNRLALIKNMMVAMENCLLSIRTTGEADSGVCKEIFTQYICALIWKIITWIRDGCLPFGKGINLAESENGVLEAISVGTRGIFDSVADSQKELASEYGNAQLNNLVGMGEEDIFRKVCLGAFGYDWEIDAESLVDVAYHSPYATLVQAVLPSREYLTFDPTTYNAKYDYRASWLVNPGCDLDNYEVYLACVTRNDMYDHSDIDCSKQKDPYGKNCDCLDLSPDKAPALLFYYQSRGKIKQNELQNIDSSQITDRIKNSPYRYDHLMFKLRVDRNYEKNKGDVSQCFPTGHEDGIFYFPITDYTAREMAGCAADITTGTFSCKQGASFFYEQGNAWFTEISVGNSTTTNILNPEGATLYAGNNNAISAIIKYSKDNRKQCLVTRLMDNDQFTIIKAPAPIELPKGETYGEEHTGSIYSVSESDISGSGSGFTIEYIDENGRRMPAAAKMSYGIAKKAEKEGGSTITFIDDLNNGEGIKIAKDSTDSYSYGGVQKKISDSYSSTGYFEIELGDIGAVIKINNVYATTAGKYEFFVQSAGKAEQQASGKPRFYLHIDLRYPSTQNGDCDEVSGIEYDDNIVVSNGISQSVDIPIYVMPGKSTTEKCGTKYEMDRELDGNSPACVCGIGTKKNCPQQNEAGNMEDDFRYCYEVCRKYPRCGFNTALNAPCVCDPDTTNTKFDCGGTSDDADAEPKETRTGFYCYQKSGDSDPSCTSTPPAVASSGQQDVTPLQVKISSPQTGYKYAVGEKIPIYAIIQDDAVSGNEKYQIIVNSNTKFEESNYERKDIWIIQKELEAGSFKPGDDVFIFIQAIDNSMASGQKTVLSDVVQVKIEAKT